jgi:tetratricopeptide (TPR) repeat protein
MPAPSSGHSQSSGRAMGARLGAALGCAIAVIAWPAASVAQIADIADCGDVLSNATGPFDYNNGLDQSDPNRIPVVEKFHFTPKVESLQGGASGAFALGDLDYTLRAIPNHHRALNAVVKYDLQHNGTPINYRPVECWFDRAFRWRPDDGTVWLIYGNWKAGKKDIPGALEAYRRAKELRPDSAELDYDLGLMYLRLGEYEKALEAARAAYGANYPLQGLRKKLAEKGYKVESAPAKTAADAAQN